MFNVHINDGTNELPKDDIFYIVAKEGIFLRKKLGIMDSIAPVDKISTLQSVAASAKMNIKKMPATTFAKIVDFFRKVVLYYDATWTVSPSALNTSRIAPSSPPSGCAT